MDTKEITEIINNSDNFSEDLEKYLLKKIAKPFNQNPFMISEEISNRLLLNTIIYCTVTLASLLYILKKR